MIGDITPMILTFNEAPNISRTLDRLCWARRIVVIDSGSTDETLNIVARYSQAEVIHRAFDNFANQCNFGLTMIRTSWVLSLDADYELTPELIDEISQLQPVNDICGYRARFIYRVYGRALRGTLYPPRTVLYRRPQAVYRNEGHGHRVHVEGVLRCLKNPIYHDDRKSLARWFGSQQRYAIAEADYLLQSDRDQLTASDKTRLIAWPAPILVFFYALLVKGCLFDGWPGWLYVMQRVLAEFMIALELLDRRLRAGLAPPVTQPSVAERNERTEHRA